MMALVAMGGRGASHLNFRNFQVNMAPIKVAREPNTISGSVAPIKILDSRQPTNSPGMAAGVKKGKMVRASEKRSWTA